MSGYTQHVKDSLPEQEVGFDLLGNRLARDVKLSLRTALAAGVVFPAGSTPIAIFRQSLATAIKRIYSDKRWNLFQRFLKDGPYEYEGKVPAKLKGQRLTDDETTSVITFIYNYMVNCFQGAIMEMLAAAPCLQILKEAQKKHLVPLSTRLYVGDAVLAYRLKGDGFAKGADFHFLTEHVQSKARASMAVFGVAEVKSYHCPPERLERQLEKHLARAKRGLKINGVDYSAEQITVGYCKTTKAIRITVLPAKWQLPRSFHFKQKEKSRVLHVDEGVPDTSKDKIEGIKEDRKQITLKWSKEALASAAYELTFWYMEKVGEVIYAEGVPREWEGMTPAEAGRNAAKMMLYYAIRRCRTAPESRRAIALYNSYGFGYALGMNFHNPDGRREMLWPEDLDEILVAGCTKNGYRLD